MLSIRQRDILRLLLESTDYLPSDVISYKLDVSSKTVLNDMRNIEFFLKSYTVKLVSKRGYGFSLQFSSQQDKESLFRAIYNISDLEDVPTQQAFIICFLLLNEEYVTQEVLTNNLFTNKRVVTELLREVRVMMKYHHIELVAKPGKGYTFEGEEYAKRLAFIYYFEQMQNHRVLAQVFHNCFSFKVQDCDDVVFADIVKMLRNGHINISEVNLQRLRIYLALMLNRLSRHHILDEQATRLQPFNALEPVSKLIIRILLKEIIEQEKDFLTIVLAFLFEKNELDMLYLHDSMSRYTANANIVSTYMDQYFEPYNYMIESPFELNKTLSLVLMMMEYQKKVGYLDQKTEIITIDDELLIAIECATLFVYYVEKHKNIRFKSNDIYALAYIFNIAFSYTPTIDKKSIVIISKKGEIVANALARRLKQEIGQYTYAITMADLPSNIVNMHPNQIVVTDMQLEDLPRSLIMNYPSLLDFDTIIPSIKYRIFDRHERLYDLLYNLTKDTYFPLYEGKTMNDIISFTIAHLGLSEAHKKSMKQSLTDRQKRFHSVIRDQVAVPRWYCEEITKTEILVFVPKRSIEWFDYKIKILFVVLQPQKFPRLNILAHPFSTIIHDNNTIQRLIQTTSLEEFKRIIVEDVG